MFKHKTLPSASNDMSQKSGSYRTSISPMIKKYEVCNKAISQAPNFMDRQQQNLVASISHMALHGTGNFH